MAKESDEPKSGLLKSLGPGLIAGASDDDPSGIATYSQIGAQFGYGMLWTMFFSYPLMVGIQEASGNIGRVTGRGIAANLLRSYPRWLLLMMVTVLVIANTINIGADIGAMGDAITLIVGGQRLLWASILAIGTLLLQVFVPYHRYVSVLKWLTVALFAYFGTVMVVKVPWDEALRHTLIPSLTLDAPHITSLVAVLGTTISPYVFFWQASEEAEDVRLNRADHALKNHPEQAAYQIKRIGRDTVIGMGFSNLVAMFIIIAVAATLNSKGIHDIQTSSQAAEALRPIAGNFAFLLFTLGIVGTGLLAIPVLAGSAAYAVGEAFKLPSSLERSFVRARGFYLILSTAIIIGLGLNFAHINAIKALFWTAVINGVAAGPIMVMIMMMGSNPKVMGEVTKILGWTATVAMILSSIAMFAYWGK